MLVSAAAPADPAATTASRCAVSSAGFFSSLARAEDPADLADPAAAPAAAPSAFLAAVFDRGPAAAPPASTSFHGRAFKLRFIRIRILASLGAEQPCRRSEGNHAQKRKRQDKTMTIIDDR